MSVQHGRLERAFPETDFRRYVEGTGVRDWNSILRFPGQWFQTEAGLHQNWMRDYDPTLGRYIQADPLGLVDGASVYGYASQNPMRYIDPRGSLESRVQLAVGH